jgi:dienelactone hydrolase
MRMRAFGLSVLLVVTVTQVGCAVTPGPAPEKLIKEYAQGGYGAGEHLATTTVQDVWTTPANERRIAVKLIAPAKAGRYPVIVYFPGLGETVDAGALWCNAWAEAGYIVVAAQPEDDDARVWRSTAARNGEFDALAREHFSATSLRRRVDDAMFVLAAARSRATSGDALLRQADFARVAIAGFDLGSQTILAMAANAAAQPIAGASVRAAIALSPYTAKAPAEEWGGIHIPVLTVTGTIDTDPYGRIPTPALRLAPFQAMPAGGKYLLVLEQGTHETLSGTPAAPPSAELTSPSRHRAQAGAEGGEPSRSRGNAPGGAGRDKERPVETAENRALAVASVSRSTLRTQMRHTAMVEATTLAFLDMTLKDSATARTWLERDAAGYYDDAAKLQAN